jgi:ankyrin repeat protein
LVLAELERSLPNDSTVIALFMPEVPNQTNPAHSFLASLLGQLLIRVPPANIPQVILSELATPGQPLPSVKIIKDALKTLLARFKRVYLILDNIGNYWDQGSLPLWTVIMGPRFANLSLMLTMQTYQNPSMTTTCTVCGKTELLVYWHCTSCKGGNHDACTTCSEKGLGCDNPSHRRVLTDVQKEKAVVDVDLLYPQALPSTSFARRIDLELFTINQRNRPRTEAAYVLMALYDSIFDELSRSPRKRLIVQALDIGYHVLRNLAVDEFLAAINLSQDFNVSEISQVTTWTGDLLKVSPDAGGTPRVHLFDDSLTRYLQEKKDKSPASGHRTLAKTCLQVLLDSTERAKSPLYDYAVCNWGSHLRVCTFVPTLDDMAMEYLMDDDKLHLGVQTAYALSQEDAARGFDAGDGLAAVHICSLFGLKNLLPRLPPAELDRPAASTGRTPLAYACGMGHVDTVLFLLKSGADPNSKDAGRLVENVGSLSALKVASMQGHNGILQLLLDAGADVNIQDSAAENSGETPLISASKMGHIGIVRLLLKNGADVNAQASAAEIPGGPLISAVRMGHTTIVKILLDKGADVNAEACGLKSSIGKSLMADSRLIHGSITKLRLDHGADLDSESAVDPADFSSVPGQTPLACACKMGHVDTVKMLLDHRADPNLERAGGITALHEAIVSKRLSVIELLLQLPTVKLTSMHSEQNGMIPLLASLLQLRSLEILRLALNRDDLDINEKDYSGTTAIWWLLRASHDRSDEDYQLDATRLIAEHPKCDINAIDHRGRTYVMRFLHVRIFDLRLLSLLLDHGADVNCMDVDGENAISYAVYTRYSFEVTSLLIRHGADLAVKNRRGQGLLHQLVAAAQGVQDLQYLDLILEHMPAFIDSRDDRGRTPLHLALVFGRTDMAIELLMRAADVDLLDGCGRAPFDIGCQYGCISILPRLTSVGIYQVEDLSESTRKDVNLQYHGGELLELHLDKLPGWSLAYLGKFYPLMLTEILI